MGCTPRLGQGVGDLIDTEQIGGVGDRRGGGPGIARQLGQFLGLTAPSKRE